MAYMSLMRRFVCSVYLSVLTEVLCDGLRNFNHGVVRSNKVPLIVYYVIKNYAIV